jgi:hypothetical protein
MFSNNSIIGELISRDKYKFVDGKIIASVVEDVMSIVNGEDTCPSCINGKLGDRTCWNCGGKMKVSKEIYE